MPFLVTTPTATVEHPADSLRDEFFANPVTMGKHSVNLKLYRVCRLLCLSKDDIALYEFREPWREKGAFPKRIPVLRSNSDLREFEVAVTERYREFAKVNQIYRDSQFPVSWMLPSSPIGERCRLIKLSLHQRYLSRSRLSKSVEMSGVYQHVSGLPVYGLESLYRSAGSNDPNTCQGDSAAQNSPVDRILNRLDAYFRGERSDLHFDILALTCIPGGFLIGGVGAGLARRRRTTFILGFLGILLALIPDIVILRRMLDERDCEAGKNDGSSHGEQIVPRKYLTNNSYWGTVIDMANVLQKDKQIAAIAALAEGSSLRSIERITGIHHDTIGRLAVKVGQGCAALLDSSMRNLPCNRLEMDEIWGFVGKKDRNVREGEDGVGSVWTFCAIDAETKLVPAFKCGNRDAATAKAFVQDVANRMAYRVQISTDGLAAYVPAMEAAFGEFVDYAQIIKTYGHEEVSDNRRYSAPKFVSSEKKIVVGNPDERLISTSYVERLNATTRLHMRRLTRLTLAFSKKRENFEAAVALHFAYYNFVKRHNTLRCTPAMAAGVTNSFWSVGDLVEASA